MVKSLLNRRFVKYFIPYVTLMGIVYLTLRGATWVRYDKHRQKFKTYSRDEIKQLGFSSEPTTLEQEYEKMVKDLNVEHWEQKRIQRPWDEEPDRP